MLWNLGYFIVEIETMKKHLKEAFKPVLKHYAGAILLCSFQVESAEWCSLVTSASKTGRPALENGRHALTSSTTPVLQTLHSQASYPATMDELISAQRSSGGGSVAGDPLRTVQELILQISQDILWTYEGAWGMLEMFSAIRRKDVVSVFENGADVRILHPLKTMVLLQVGTKALNFNPLFLLTGSQIMLDTNREVSSINSCTHLPAYPSPS